MQQWLTRRSHYGKQPRWTRRGLVNGVRRTDLKMSKPPREELIVSRKCLLSQGDRTAGAELSVPCPVTSAWYRGAGSSDGCSLLRVYVKWQLRLNKSAQRRQRRGKECRKPCFGPGVKTVFALPPLQAQGTDRAERRAAGSVRPLRRTTAFSDPLSIVHPYPANCPHVGLQAQSATFDTSQLPELFLSFSYTWPLQLQHTKPNYSVILQSGCGASDHQHYLCIKVNRCCVSVLPYCIFSFRGRTALWTGVAAARRFSARRFSTRPQSALGLPFLGF